MSYLVEHAIPNMLLIIGEKMKHITIQQFPREVTSELLADASDIVGNSSLYIVLKKRGGSTSESAGKYGIGSIIFINREGFKHCTVTKSRAKKHMQLLGGAVQPSAFKTVKELERQFISLESATKCQVFADGALQTMWVGDTKSFTLHGTDVASIVGRHLDGGIDVKALVQSVIPTRRVGRPAKRAPALQLQPPPAVHVDTLTGLPIAPVAGGGRRKHKRRKPSAKSKTKYAHGTGRQFLGEKVAKFFSRRRCQGWDSEANCQEW